MFNSMQIFPGGGLGSNAQIDNATFSQIVLPTPQHWNLAHSVTQSIATVGTTVLNWDTNITISGVSHATVTTSSIVTITVSGPYILGVHVDLASAALTSTHHINLQVNGSDISHVQVAPATALPADIVACKILQVNDTVSVSGTSQSVARQVNSTPAGHISFWGQRVIG